MAEELGVDRASVSRMENGQRISGPVLRLIVALIPAAPPSVGTTPSEGLSVPVTSDGVDLRSAAGPLSRGVAAAEDTLLPGSSSAAARTPEVTA